MVYGQGYLGYPSQYGLGQNPNLQSLSQPQFAIQSGGFVSVASEDDARKYPVAPGNSVTFKNENAPYVYTKTMGFSQLDRPLFEKFRLVKEEDTSNQIVETKEETIPEIKYLSQEDLEPLVEDIKKLQTKIKKIDSVLEGLNKSSCIDSDKESSSSSKNKLVEKGTK